MLNLRNFDLQLFADAGTVVNATTGYVNAYDGNRENFSGENTLSPTLKEFYDTELLENARVELFYAQFGKKQRLPKRHGKSMEWRKWNTFKPADKIEEAVIPEPQKFGETFIRGAIDQYGTFTAVSDILEMRGYDDVILGATEEMGASAALTQEKLIRDSLLVNTNVFYCDNCSVNPSPATGRDLYIPESTPMSCAEMECVPGDIISVFTPDMVAKAVTTMKKNRVPTINGKYYAVIHPSVAYDLRKSDAWIDAHKYSATTEIFNGEIGELHGCRFIEDTFAPILDGDYVNKAGTVTYATYMFGKDAFGTIDAEGGNLQMIVKNKGVAGGPLEQFSTIGYKFEGGVVILYPERVMRIMSCSSFSGIDEAN